MHDIDDVDSMERMLDFELSSADLFKIDCAILNSLRNNSDFSRDLLHQLETGKFEMITERPQKSFELHKQEALMDITLPLQDLFDDLAVMVEEALT